MAEHVAAGDRNFVDEEYEEAVKHYTKVGVQRLSHGCTPAMALQGTHPALSVSSRLWSLHPHQVHMRLVQMHTYNWRSTSKPCKTLAKPLSLMARTLRPTCAKGELHASLLGSLHSEVFGSLTTPQPCAGRLASTWRSMKQHCSASRRASSWCQATKSLRSGSTSAKLN